MKPTVKVIITGPSQTDGIDFVHALSETEVTQHEKKVPNPLSATREEALLLPETGRLERDNLAVQMQALTAHKRYDFVWSVLLKEVYGVIVLVDGSDAVAVDEARRLLKLFAMMSQPNCLVAIRRQGDEDDRQLAAVQARLNTSYPVISYGSSEREEANRVLSDWIEIVPPPEEPVRRRTRSASNKKG